MPKKRTYNFKPLQGSSTASSKQAGAQNGDDSSNPSVNERLSELRKLEGKDAAAKKQQLAESVNQRSVPPELRKVLGVPESAPPKPKIAVRFRDRMRTPGPAPPRSWLASSSTWTPTLAMRDARRGLRKNANSNDRRRPKQLLRFARLAGLEHDDVDKKPSSLSHIALKSIAESWDLFEQEDYPALVDVPLRLRLRLISYIDFYGPPLALGELQALLQGSESVQHLDLAGLLGHANLTVKKVTKLLERKQEVVQNDSSPSIAESWDADDSFETALQPLLGVTRFGQLTHLCLSHPGPAVSWRDLLVLTKLTPQITHLSLAYWPRPTLTPNLSTTTVSSQHSPDVTAGGSHYYSSLDEDTSEPASLLRQLSSNLLCLQWLDLEGCHVWVPALTKLTEYTQVASSTTGASSTSDDWTAGPSKSMTAFSTNWKNLSYLRCAQGWLPSLVGMQKLKERDESSLDRLIVDGVVKYLQEHIDSTLSATEPPSQDIVDIEKKKATIWLRCEYKLTYACMRINSVRRTQGCKPIEMDFGWVQRHVVPIQI